jgi:hypothetical protein
MEATVLIPTHDHGPLLEFAVRGVLGQTLQDFEILVVGDGVPPSARPHVERVARLDPRVRYFDFPKARRTGETYRNTVLAEAKGQIICYLADDDLWLPGHLEEMATLLREAEFAQALTLRVYPDGRKEVLVVDIGQPEFRRLVVEGSSRIHLSSAGHTTALFRRLPHGWRETPPGIPTDYYMWQHILERPDVLAASGHRATAIVFPSPLRASSSLEERVAETRAWSARLGDAAFSEQVQSWAFSAISAAWLEQYREAERRATGLRSMHESVADMRRQLEEKERAIQASHAAGRWWRRRPPTAGPSGSRKANEASPAPDQGS